MAALMLPAWPFLIASICATGSTPSDMRSSVLPEKRSDTYLLATSLPRSMADLAIAADATVSCVLASSTVSVISMLCGTSRTMPDTPSTLSFVSLSALVMLLLTLSLFCSTRFCSAALTLLSSALFFIFFFTAFSAAAVAMEVASSTSVCCTSLLTVETFLTFVFVFALIVTPSNLLRLVSRPVRSLMASRTSLRPSLSSMSVKSWRNPLMRSRMPAFSASERGSTLMDTLALPLTCVSEKFSTLLSVQFMLRTELRTVCESIKTEPQPSCSISCS